ncbi:MAG: cyclic nucleotide-binding domain-containing protein [Bacteroidota bacterium]
MNNDSWVYARLKSKLRDLLKRSDGLWEEMMQYSEVIELKRGDTLINHSELNKCIYVVVKGIFECTLKTEQNTHNLVWFFFDNAFSVILSMDSYCKDHKTKYEVIALEPSVVIKFEIEQIEHIKNSYKAFDEFQKNEIIDWFFNYFEIRNNLLALSPIAFLDYLETNYPSIPNRIPSHKLAHFMGITPEWLSKLKKRRQLQFAG